MITMTPETLEAYIQKARDEGFEKAWKQAGHLDLDLRQRDVQIAELKAENARYREALGFYAEAWELGDYNGDLLVRKIGSYDAFEEVHERAREALKGE
jgi:hypothetical protein